MPAARLFSIALAQPPQPVFAVAARHGERHLERYRLAGLWQLHLNGYPTVQSTRA